MALECVNFKLGREYSRQQISRKIGGQTGQYLPTRNGQVIAACVKKEMNLPPDLILVGKLPRTIKTSDQLVKQGQKGDNVPLFQQQGPGRWQYTGMYQAIDYFSAHDHPDLIEKY